MLGGRRAFWSWRRPGGARCRSGDRRSRAGRHAAEGRGAEFPCSERCAVRAGFALTRDADRRSALRARGAMQRREGMRNAGFSKPPTSQLGAELAGSLQELTSGSCVLPTSPGAPAWRVRFAVANRDRGHVPRQRKVAEAGAAPGVRAPELRDSLRDQVRPFRSFHRARRTVFHPRGRPTPGSNRSPCFRAEVSHGRAPARRVGRSATGVAGAHSGRGAIRVPSGVRCRSGDRRSRAGRHAAEGRGAGLSLRAWRRPGGFRATARCRPEVRRPEPAAPSGDRSSGMCGRTWRVGSPLGCAHAAHGKQVSPDVEVSISRRVTGRGGRHGCGP